MASRTKLLVEVRLYSINWKISSNKIKFKSIFYLTKKGVAECGLSVASKGIFQNGAFDLIDFFYKRCNAEMGSYLENLVKEGKVTRKNELIRSALLYRLTLIQPYIDHWPKVYDFIFIP